MELPDGWVNATLTDLGDWSSGGTPNRKKNEYFGGDIPWILTGDLQDSGIQSAPNSITQLGLENSSAKIFPPGTLLIAMYGATIGKLGVLQCAAATNQACAALQPCESNRTALPFVYYFLLSQRGLLRKLGKGGAQPNISQTILKNLDIALPPLNEQHRIVEKIDTLFARLDAGEAALRDVQKGLARYRQSVLKAAVTGELTRDWRAEHADHLEHGRDLLARILEARREHWRGRGKYKEPAAPDTTDLRELPNGWVWASTEQLAFVQTGATPKKNNSEYYAKTGTPWLTSTAINEDVIRTPQAYVTDKAIAETNAKLFPAGSLIVAMYGEGKTRGKVAELGIDAATNQACAALLIGHLASPVAKYLKLFYHYNYEAIRLLSSGGVQPNLNLGLVKSTPVPLPPEQEAAEIIFRVDAEVSRIDAADALRLSALRGSKALRQSILKQAFAGRLVPQNPNDEPASALLARIRAERDVATPRPRRKPTKPRA